jgi:hypothetical protein
MNYKAELTVAATVSDMQSSPAMYASTQRPLIGRSGRQLTVGAGHARIGTQIPGLARDRWLPWRLIDCRPSGGYRRPYLKSALPG